MRAQHFQSGRFCASAKIQVLTLPHLNSRYAWLCIVLRGKNHKQSAKSTTPSWPVCFPSHVRNFRGPITRCRARAREEELSFRDIRETWG